MNRRDFLRNTNISVLGLASGIACFNLLSCSRNEKKPNFLVIVCDDAGWGDVGYHGSLIKTPNIDRLNREGVELNQFYVYPTCSPTRASLLTGRPPCRTGFHRALNYDDTRGIPDGTVTLAEMLRRHGYDTAISGKWHLGGQPEVGPNHHGFNHSYGFLGAWVDQYTHRTRNNIRTWHRNCEFVDEEGHATDLITREALRFITDIRDTSKPFFLLVTYNVPHLPLQEKEWRVSPYRDVFEAESRSFYAASMTHMDEAIGKLIEKLEEENLDKDTLVIFFSDNGGESGGNKGYLQPVPTFRTTTSLDYYGDNRPLRGWKYQLYEGGIRVPALMRWPGILEPRKVDDPMIVYDIMPTLAHLSGAAVTDDMHVEGRNIWPAVIGDSVPGDRIFYWGMHNQLAVRVGDWKLIHNNGSPDEGSEELFNITEDPYEEHDLAEENPEKCAELHRELVRQFNMDEKSI